VLGTVLALGSMTDFLPERQRRVVMQQTDEDVRILIYRGGCTKLARGGNAKLEYTVQKDAAVKYYTPGL
jgi:hypothetical protein